MNPRIAVIGTIALFITGAAPRASRVPLPEVRANDNRTAAGTLQGDTLELHLVVAMATWRPEADTGPDVDVAAFSEAGKPPMIPAPLIRVRAGTVIVATVRNALSDSTITVHGLVSHPAAKNDPLLLRPGDSATVRFIAGEPGTYLYSATVGRHDYTKFNLNEREQLGGAFVVDPRGGSPPDRVLVINIWSEPIDSVNDRNALTINGRSWPYDERISATVGDTVRWRVVNASNRGHPMHLHGFYYQVTARGSTLQDSTFPPEKRSLVVTQSMRPFSTMAMNYIPDRPGNWLFHCHIGFHVVPDAARLAPLPPDSHDRMSDDPRLHMAGLVVGISVRPSPSWRPRKRVQPRRMRLLIQEGPRRSRAPRALGFVLQNAATPPASDSIEIPGSLLVLTRGQPTDIVVVNRLHETAAIHWHGVELESWSDGVAGWSGMDAAHVAPSIQPGDSFVAHLTLPRAGTFIYHTHMNDLEQLTSGLYGAIVVLEPGQRFDPATDHVFVLGWDGNNASGPQHRVINGDSLPAPIQLRAGVAHRMRLVNIGAAGRLPFSLLRDSMAVMWRALAKDGADLPEEQVTMRRAARQSVDVGETYDFEWRPEPGNYLLTATIPGQRPFYVQKIVVR
jgi:manganese oxidase